MFLLEGAPVPDHATIARFRSLHFAQCSERILAEMTNILYEIGEKAHNFDILKQNISEKVHENMSFVKVRLFYKIPQYFNKNEYRFTQKRLRINCF